MGQRRLNRSARKITHYDFFKNISPNVVDIAALEMSAMVCFAKKS